MSEIRPLKWVLTRLLLPLCLLAGVLFVADRPLVAGRSSFAFRTGDIIFQEHESSQSEAIRLATGSRYTHVGMVMMKDGKVSVVEAGGKVRVVPVKDFIAQGKKEHYVVKRLKEADRILNGKGAQALIAAAEGFTGKIYDPYFRWSDDRIYCSELVWKIYQRGIGVQLASPRPARDYRLGSPVVRELIERRYGTKVPLDEKIVAPSDLFNSSLLATVRSM